MIFPVSYPEIDYVDLLGGQGGLIDTSRNDPLYSDSSQNNIRNIYDNSIKGNRCSNNVIRTTPSLLVPYDSTNYNNGNKIRVNYSIVGRNGSYMNALQVVWSHANISGDNELSHAYRIRSSLDARYLSSRVLGNFPINQNDKIVVKFRIRAYNFTNVGDIYLRFLFGQTYNEAGRLQIIEDTTGTNWASNFGTEWRTITYKYHFTDVSSGSNYEKFMFPIADQDRARLFIQFKKLSNSLAWSGVFEIADIEIYIENSDNQIKHVKSNIHTNKTAKLFMFDMYHPSAIYDNSLMKPDMVRLNHFYEGLSIKRMNNVVKTMINLDLTGNVINSPKLSLFYRPKDVYKSGTINSLDPEEFLYVKVLSSPVEYIRASIDNGNRCKVDLNNSNIREVALLRLKEKILSCGVLVDTIFLDNALFQNNRPSTYNGNNIEQNKYYRIVGSNFVPITVDEYYQMIWDFVQYLKNGLDNDLDYGEEFRKIKLIPNAGTKGAAYEHPNSVLVDTDKNFATVFYNFCGGFLTENTPSRFDLGGTNYYLEPIIHPYNDNANWNSFVPITTGQMFSGRSLSHFLKGHKRNLTNIMICGIPIDNAVPLYQKYGNADNIQYDNNSSEYQLKTLNALKSQKLMLASYFLTMNNNSYIGIADNNDDYGNYLNKVEYSLNLGTYNSPYTVLEPTDYGGLDGVGGLIERKFYKNNVLSGIVLLNPLGSFWKQEGDYYWEGEWYTNTDMVQLSETFTYELPSGIWKDIDDTLYVSTNANPFVLTVHPKSSFILKNVGISEIDDDSGSSYNIDNISRISMFNQFVYSMFNQCIMGLPFECNFGYRNLVLQNNHPSWNRISKTDELEFDFSKILSAIYIYFSGDVRGRAEEYSTIGSLGVKYKYKIDILLPVSNGFNSEFMFWDRIDKLIRRVVSFDYKALDSRYPDSILIEPLSAIFEEPYTDFGNMLCHYASYEMNIIYSHRHGFRIRN